MAETKCKVCDHPFPLTETFCPECGFERHVFPALISKEVEEYEKKRIKEYKERWEQVQEQIKKLNSDLQTAKDKSVVVKQKLGKKEQLVALLTDENAKLEEGKIALEQELRAENGKVLEMEADLRKALEDANKSNLSDLKGIVIISDMTSLNQSDMSAYASIPINRQCLPVLSGVNTYGSANSEGNHYQITIKCRGDVFLPKHFAVDTSHSRGLVIKDLSNGRITLYGNPFNEEYAGNSKFFIKQGRQIFVVEIKMLNL